RSPSQPKNPPYPLSSARSPKNLVRGDSKVDKAENRNRVLEGFADKQLPHDRRLRIGVHDYPKPRLDVLAARVVLVAKVVPASAEEGPNRACTRQTVQPLEGVFLDDRAIGCDNCEHRFAGAVRRWAEQCGSHRARAQRAKDNLWLQRRSHDVAVSQAARIDSADQVVWRTGERLPGRIVDRGSADPCVTKRRVRRPDAAKGVVVREAERIAHPGELSGFRARVVNAVEPMGTVGAEHLHGSPEGRGLVPALRKIRWDAQDSGTSWVDREERAFLPAAAR